MRITVFGAGGKVGQLVVGELLQRQHEVTVFVHRSSPFEADDNLHIVRGDIHDPAAVLAAVTGSHAVISALGSWGTSSKDILSAGVANIIAAMKAEGVQRIVSVTGADARAEGDSLSLLHRASHAMLGIIGGKVLADGERHIKLLAASGIDWTVLRSPVMTSSQDATYHMTTIRPLPWSTVPRAAVAKALVDQTLSSDYSRQAPFIIRV